MTIGELEAALGMPRAASSSPIVILLASLSPR